MPSLSSSISSLSASFLSCFIHVVDASLPLGSIGKGNLQHTSDSFSFDPLALLAILHNPRAAASAARLYNQHDLSFFRWPHTMMVGGALAPFKLLVDHLALQRLSVHPAVTMCLADTTKLPVRSTTAFSELPLCYSNHWLTDLISFRPSEQPGNDLLIANVENIHGVPAKSGHISGTDFERLDSFKNSTRIGRIVLELIGLTTGLLLVAGLVVSVLAGDMWSTTLFSAYFLHWMSSTAIAHSKTTLVSSRGVDHRVRVDDSIQFAVYTRPAGGKVVFKARQDTLETWARMTWEFNRTPGISGASILHWSWMLTGTLSAITSVVCMVNMAGYFQLGYLGALIISSMGEIVVTQIARRIQHTAIHYGESFILNENIYWSNAIIRSVVEVPDNFSLAGFDWIENGLLPDMPIFRNLQAVLGSMGMFPAPTNIAERLKEGVEAHFFGLAERLAVEIYEALDIRYGGNSKSIKNVIDAIK